MVEHLIIHFVYDLYGTLRFKCTSGGDPRVASTTINTCPVIRHASYKEAGAGTEIRDGFLQVNWQKNYIQTKNA